MDGKMRFFLDMVNLTFEHNRDTGSEYLGIRTLSQPKRLLLSFHNHVFQNVQISRCPIVGHRSQVTHPRIYHTRSF